MKKKIAFLVIFSLVFLSYNIKMHAIDYNRFLPKMKEPSLSAYQFIRYGEVPVDYSTGVPKIEIPLYTLKTSNMEIPISISYHAGGHKVTDVAGPVGLGWTLNAGGMISQVNYGLIDSLRTVPFTNAAAAKELIKKKEYGLDYWLAFISNTPKHDNISDRYCYNFGGHSGVFRTDMSTNEMKTIPYDPLKIEKTGSIIKITDTEGNIWTFKKMGDTGSSLEYYLTTIQFPGMTDNVQFQYSNKDIYTVPIYMENSYYGRYEDSNTMYKYIDVVEGTGLYSESYKYERNWNVDYRIGSGIVLTSIKWKDVNILFNYLSDRLDPMKRRLDNISINHGSSQISKISFTNKGQYLGDKADNYRMLLKGVSIDDKKYTFKYNENIKLPTYRPDINKEEMSGDFWGYFNGYYKHNQIIPFEWNSGNKGAGKEEPEKARIYRYNRESNPSYTQAGILQEIYYPTGGKTVFVFEQNKGNQVYSSDLKRGYTKDEEYFGGLRVRQIIDMQGNEVLRTKTYEYKGGPTEQVSFNHFVYNRYFYYNMIASGYGYIITQPQLGNASTNGISGRLGVPPLHYHTVTEYFGTDDKNLGKKVYSYDQDPYYKAASCGDFIDYVGPRFLMNYYGCDYGELRPELKTITEYEFKDGKYKIKKETKNDYTTISKASFVTGVEFYHLYSFVNLSASGGPYFANGPVGDTQSHFWNNIYSQNSYGFQETKPLLSKTVISNHEDGGIITSTTNYIYDKNGRILSPIETSLTNSDGKTSKEALTHPFNYNVFPYNKMIAKNILSPIISKTNTMGNSSYVVKYHYKEDDIRYVPDYIESGKNNDMEIRIKYHKYDKYGNPLYISKDEGIDVVYLWSYKGNYLIAEIKNTTYDQVKRKISIESLSEKTAPSTADMNAIRKLQNDLPGVSIITYTYKPLVGMISMTDPSGKTTYYDYDSYGRLNKIYLRNGYNEEVLQSYHYNYTNK